MSKLTVLVVIIACEQFIYDLTDIMIEEFNLLNPWNSQAVAEDVKVLVSGDVYNMVIMIK